MPTSSPEPQLRQIGEPNSPPLTVHSSLRSDTVQNRVVIPVATFARLSAAKDLKIVVASRGKKVTIDGVGIATH